MDFADLHIHTKCSDGILAPEKILHKASLHRISAISITDHDTIDGFLEAYPVQSKYDVELIPGIELSCVENGTEYHILAYNFDPSSQVLTRHLDYYRSTRVTRTEKMLKKLEQFDIFIKLDDVIERFGDTSLARPHVATMLSELGYVDNIKEAFNIYLGDGMPACQVKVEFSVKSAIDLIKKAGGISVLAHPAKYVSRTRINQMIQEGINGIEVWHPMHLPPLQRKYLKIVDDNLLIPTGGSDYHGYRPFDEQNFGKFTVPYSVVETIKYSTLV
jgi:3',5'-nucleoside bisphosphate phosphatase